MSLRICTFNVQFLTKGALSVADYDPFPDTDADERAELIAHRIGRFTDFDVIAFNECFDDAATGLLMDKLRGRGYHWTLHGFGDDEVTSSLLSPVAAGAAGGLVGGLGGAAAAAAGAAALSGKLGNSGLAIASRLRFEDVPSAPGENSRFHMFTSGAGDDRYAAKGVAYVRVLQSFIDAHGKKQRSPVNIVATHLQADDQPDVRAAQFAEITAFVLEVLGPDRFATEEIVVVGDTNVNGDLTTEWRLGSEWYRHFHPQSPKKLGFFADKLHDAWTAQQPGAPVDPKDTLDEIGSTWWMRQVDPGHTRLSTRYDYAFTTARSRIDPKRLAVQHVRVAHELIEQGPRYISDHRPVAVDLHLGRPHCTPLTAEVLSPSKPGEVVQIADQLVDGQVRWFMITEPGTYTIGLLDSAGALTCDVYERNELSRPMPPYRNLTRDLGTPERPLVGHVFALPEAPFLIRVGERDRHSETASPFELHVLQHEGLGPDDAVLLTPANAQRGVFRQHAPYNLPGEGYPSWYEGDCYWFRLDLHTAPRPQNLRFLLEDTDATGAFSLLLVGEGDQELEIVDAAGTVDATATIERRDRGPRPYYLLVQRRDPAFLAYDFTIRWETDLTFLHGPRAAGSGPPIMLVCEHETDPQIGSDDIYLNIYADGAHLQMYTVGDMDSEKNPRQLDLAPIPFFKVVQIEIVEEDDLSADETGSVWFGPLAPHEPGPVHTAGTVGFAGGRYRVTASFSHWLPTAP